MYGISFAGWRRLLICMAALHLSPCAAQTTLQPFASDGCSSFPDRSPIPLGKAMDWCNCCLTHDLAYWRGGTEDERLKADLAFQACIFQNTNDQVLANAMFQGVRLGGGPEIRTSYRWGYGWPYGRRYRPLDAEEKARADALEREYLAANPATLVCPAPGRP